MGTSGAYGGSPGWGGVSDQTEEWLGLGGGSSSAGGTGASTPPEGQDGSSTDAPDSASSGSTAYEAAIAGILGALGNSFATGGGSSGRTHVRRTRSAGHTEPTRTGRNTRRAATVGGRGLSGAYGLRSGVDSALAELGLSLADLEGLPKYQQAQRILDAAAPPSGDVNESELRVVNAEVVYWALNEEVEPSPLDLANRWIVEFVWQTWITESGPALRAHSADGYDSLRAEQEMRAVLEATITAQGLPTDRPLTANDFGKAIEEALASLGRIGGKPT